MVGFKSDMMFLPEHGVGAVLLTNSDTGGMLLARCMRRLLEVLFDGKPEAAGMSTLRAANYKAAHGQGARAAGRAGGAAAGRQTGRALRERRARRNRRQSRMARPSTFDFGEWKSAVASRKNDDGTISFITIDPT